MQMPLRPWQNGYVIRLKINNNLKSKEKETLRKDSDLKQEKSKEKL